MARVQNHPPLPLRAAVGKHPLPALLRVAWLSELLGADLEPFLGAPCLVFREPSLTHPVDGLLDPQWPVSEHLRQGGGGVIVAVVVEPVSTRAEQCVACVGTLTEPLDTGDSVGLVGEAVEARPASVTVEARDLTFVDSSG